MHGNSVPNKWQLGAIVIIAFGSLYASITFGGPPTKFIDMFRLLSASITSVTIAVGAFHLGLWRWMPHFLAPKPIVDGTWQVTGIPWSQNGEEAIPFTGFLFVKQYYFTLSMNLVTEHTTSELVVEQFRMTKGGQHELWAIYFCEPCPTVDPNRFRPHYGAVRLALSIADERMRLTGRYWIDGDFVDQYGKHVSGGQLCFSNRKDKIFGDYNTAVQAYK